MARVIHFEIPADQPERAMAFYQSVFDWSFQKWEGEMPYWMVSTGPSEKPGIDGAIMPREAPGQGVNNVMQVESLEASIEKVKASGGEMLTPIIPIPGIGRCANAKDTEGNSFGMMQPDESVA